MAEAHQADRDFAGEPSGSTYLGIAGATALIMVMAIGLVVYTASSSGHRAPCGRPGYSNCPPLGGK